MFYRFYISAIGISVKSHISASLIGTYGEIVLLVSVIRTVIFNIQQFFVAPALLVMHLYSVATYVHDKVCNFNM